MRYLLFRLIIPLTIISFGLFTKWWHAIPVDAPDIILFGFPWPYVCPGFHTSLSLQIFILEFVADLIIYFLFWLTLVYFATRKTKLKLVLFIPISLWVISSLFIAFGLLFAVDKNNKIHFKMPFEIAVLDSGVKFFFQNKEHPEYREQSKMENK